MVRKLSEMLWLAIAVYSRATSTGAKVRLLGGPLGRSSAYHHFTMANPYKFNGTISSPVSCAAEDCAFNCSTLRC